MLEAHILEWLNLAVRWFHVIAGIAWIGSSFYFVWLDVSLEPPDPPNDRLKGALWAIHGGGFYYVQKYKVAPEKLPKTLHWFKWEAYTTWLSGFGLFILIYYINAGTYLIDPTVSALSATQAIVISLGGLIGGWLIYDLICRSPIGRHDGVLGLLVFVLIGGAAYLFSQLFGSRAAYIQVGAMIGTIMAANVFFIIMPGQRALVAAAKRGEDPDPTPGIKAKQRSLHNNYFTLPVVFIMLSNHYPFTYGHLWNWAILIGISLAGVMIRHFFNLRNAGKIIFWLWVGATIIMLGLVFVTRPAPVASGRPVEFAEARAIIEKRCVQCHAEHPTDTVFVAPPLGVILEKPDKIKAMAHRIRERAVVLKTMPLANKTQMTDDERAALGRWIEAGARID